MRPHILPVAALLGLHPGDDVVVEVVGEDPVAAFQHHRDDMLAEIEVLVMLLPLQQHLDQLLGGEDVVAHGGEAGLAPGDRLRDLGLFGETGDPGVVVHGEDAEAAGLFKGHLEGGDGDVGPVHAVAG